MDKYKFNRHINGEILKVMRGLLRKRQPPQNAVFFSDILAHFRANANYGENIELIPERIQNSLITLQLKGIIKKVSSNKKPAYTFAPAYTNLYSVHDILKRKSLDSEDIPSDAVNKRMKLLTTSQTDLWCTKVVPNQFGINLKSLTSLFGLFY